MQAVRHLTVKIWAYNYLQKQNGRLLLKISPARPFFPLLWTNIPFDIFFLNSTIAIPKHPVLWHYSHFIHLPTGDLQSLLITVMSVVMFFILEPKETKFNLHFIILCRNYSKHLLQWVIYRWRSRGRWKMLELPNDTRWKRGPWPEKYLVSLMCCIFRILIPF